MGEEYVIFKFSCFASRNKFYSLISLFWSLILQQKTLGDEILGSSTPEWFLTCLGSILSYNARSNRPVSSFRSLCVNKVSSQGLTANNVMLNMFSITHANYCPIILLWTLCMSSILHRTIRMINSFKSLWHHYFTSKFGYAAKITIVFHKWYRTQSV